MVVIVMLAAIRSKAVARFCGWTGEAVGIEKITLLKEQITEEFAVHDFVDVRRKDKLRKLT